MLPHWRGLTPKFNVPDMANLGSVDDIMDADEEDSPERA